MKILITGAAGFLGRYVVTETLNCGHEVVALVRPTSKLDGISWEHHPRVCLKRLDLCQVRGIEETLEGVNAVIHLAASKMGDFQTQYNSTVVATQNLLSAMTAKGVFRLIAVSTFSVYDYLKIRTDQILDEATSLETNPSVRDAYTHTKLIQEDLYRNFGQHPLGQVTIFRPGMIYGRDHLWHPLLGVKISEKLWLKVGQDRTLPLIYVENCAEVLVKSLKLDSVIDKTINLVDDHLPTCDSYIKMLLHHTSKTQLLMIPLRWAILKHTVDKIWWLSQTLLKVKKRLPGILVPSRLSARFKPLSYSNTNAKVLLNWSSRYSLREAIVRSQSQNDLLKAPNSQIFDARSHKAKVSQNVRNVSNQN